MNGTNKTVGTIMMAVGAGASFFGLLFIALGAGFGISMMHIKSADGMSVVVNGAQVYGEQAVLAMHHMGSVFLIVFGILGAVFLLAGLFLFFFGKKRRGRTTTV